MALCLAGHIGQLLAVILSLFWNTSAQSSDSHIEEDLHSSLSSTLSRSIKHFMITSATHTQPRMCTCTHSHTHTHTHTHGWQGIKIIMKIETGGLEVVSEQVSFKGSFERGSRLRLAECLRQTVPNGVTSVTYNIPLDSLAVRLPTSLGTATWQAWYLRIQLAPCIRTIHSRWPPEPRHKHHSTSITTAVQVPQYKYHTLQYRYHYRSSSTTV